ncbi:MAG: nucleotidyltransferase family protein [Deltaproteobacteria bacterium]
MKALILAAGYGTRLYPYTKNFPKPLLEINGKPIIGYLVDKLSAVEGISEIIVVTNSRFYRTYIGWKKGIKAGPKISILSDGTTSPEDKLGAIGDMEFVFKKENRPSDFLVLGGDNFFEEPLEDFMSAARKNKAVTIGVCRIKSRKEASNYGVVELDGKGRVISLEEKPKKPRSKLISMCLYYFPASSKGLLGRYLSDPANTRDTIGAYIRWISENGKMCGHVFKHFWYDIGSLSAYNQARATAKGEHQR